MLFRNLGTVASSSALLGDRRRTAPSDWTRAGVRRVSPTKQSLERQLEAMAAAGIPVERIFTDKKTGVTVEREGLAGC